MQSEDHHPSRRAKGREGQGPSAYAASYRHVGAVTDIPRGRHCRILSWIRCEHAQYFLDAYVSLLSLAIFQLTLVHPEYAYFFFYSFVRSTYIKRTTKPGAKPAPLSTVVELLLGALAGALGQIFTIPVAVIATRQQIGRSAQGASTRPTSIVEDKSQEVLEDIPSTKTEDSIFDVARDIIREDGVQGLWLGLNASLVLTVNPAITYGVFERVKSIFTLGDPTVKMGPYRSFSLGALSKTLATVVCSPQAFSDLHEANFDRSPGNLPVHHGQGASASPRSCRWFGSRTPPPTPWCPRRTQENIQGGRHYRMVPSTLLSSSAVGMVGLCCNRE